MASIHRETLKNIKAGLSDEKRLNNLMLDRLYKAVMSGNKTQANVLAKAIKILFPRSNCMVADAQFRALWKLGKRQEAIKVYLKVKRTIFWYSERVSGFYERQGQMSKAIEEYEFLMNTYSKMGSKGILPLPNGPVELLKIGKYFSSRNKVKARKYLELYLSAEGQWKSDPSFRLRKNEAQRILNRLDNAKE